VRDSAFDMRDPEQVVNFSREKQLKSSLIGLSFQCGGAYTSKLEGMLNDFILADVMNKDFQPHFAAWREKEDNQELVRLNCIWIFWR
jgi:hypothetical protein